MAWEVLRTGVCRCSFLGNLRVPSSPSAEPSRVTSSGTDLGLAQFQGEVGPLLDQFPLPSVGPHLPSYLLKSRSPLTWELHRLLQGVSKKLRAHREELFAPNVRVRVNGRWVVRHVHRSNGSTERKFHGLRHTCPRITGDDGREGQVQREGPGMLMVKNLKDSRYLRPLYGALSHLGERFARVAPEALEEAKTFSRVRRPHRQTARLAVNNRTSSRCPLPTGSSTSRSTRRCSELVLHPMCHFRGLLLSKVGFDEVNRHVNSRGGAPRGLSPGSVPR